MSGYKRFQRFLVIILIAVGFFYGGYYMGKRGFVFEIRKNPPQVEIINKYPGDQDIDFSLFWEVWDLVSKDYLLRPVDSEAMMYGAIQGMVSSLDDPYTSFLKPSINETVTEALEGKYQGIGAELGMKEDQLIIVAPLDGSPAKEAGVRAGDKILKIEDEGTVGLSITEAVHKIRGAANTKITLTLQRENEEPREVVITRGVITLSSVSWEDKGNGIAYIRISRFGGETNTEWDKAVDEINVKMNELDSVIVDVRGNPGGYLQAAVYLAGEFYRGEPVIYQENALGEQIPIKTERIGDFTNIPAVYVLIDGGSASASEILAAALRSNADAVLVGQTSFGKGTIQDAKDFEDGSGLHITIAKWLTPEKEWVHEEGIEPDVKVEITEEDIENNTDSQLNRAIELANEI